MELLPSGCVLGGASLYVETDKGRLLYAPHLQTQRIPTVRQMQLKKANTLILGASHPDPLASMPPRKKEKDRLLETIQALIKSGAYPILVCEPVSTAQEITKLLGDHGIPVAVHDAIFKVHNVYEAYGSKLGNYTRYSKKYTKQKVTLFPLPNKKTILLRSALPDGPVIYVENTTERTVAPTAFGAIAERFFIGSTCDGPEIKEVVAAVSPRELYVFGPYAKRYVEAFEGLCPVVKPLFVNDQPTLF
jgi:Cft2 family RNA processing exonuclease